MLDLDTDSAKAELVIRMSIMVSLTKENMNISLGQPEDIYRSLDLVNTINIVCNCIGVNAVCMFGIAGNIINIIVLYRHGFRDSTNILLFSMSVSDLLLVITLPVGRLHGLVYQFDHILAFSIQSTATIVFLTVNRSLLFASIDHIGVISIERFVAIFFPFHVSRIFTAKTMKTIVGCIYLVNFITLLPWFAAFNLVISKDLASNKTLAYARPTQFYYNNEKTLNIYGAVTNFASILFNLALVTVSCLAIAIKLFVNTWQRSKFIGQDQSKRMIVQTLKVSKMLLTLCIVFYVIFFPTTLLDMYLYFGIEKGLLVNPRYVAVQYISGLMFCINSSINFLIYVTMSRKYYNTYQQLFACCRLNVDT